MKNKGFTLLELMIVIVIIAILASLGIKEMNYDGVPSGQDNSVVIQQK